MQKAKLAPSSAPHPATRKRILLVDDEPAVLESTSLILKRANYDVEAYGEAESALERITKFQPDVLITDVSLPSMDGINLASQVRAVLPKCEIVLYSGTLVPHLVRFAQLNQYELVPKPLDSEQLMALLKR